MGTTWKLLPGMGECINLMMALIFDAEYQHSKVIQDSLPVLAKDVERFNTCCEGVIYEYKEKRKPGLICYRHADTKKADLVRATFHGYISLWEEIYQDEFKDQQHLLPKGFYKKMVERNLKAGGRADKSPEKDSLQGSGSGNLQPFGSLQQMRTSGTGELGRTEPVEPVEPVEAMNSSFHIRRKKTLPHRKDSAAILSEEMIRIR